MDTLLWRQMVLLHSVPIKRANMLNLNVRNACYGIIKILLRCTLYQKDLKIS